MKRFAPAAALACAVLALTVTALSWRGYRPPFPPLSGISEVRGGAAGDAMALSFGLRRLAADVWFIRLMQYYGTPENHEDCPEGEHGHEAHGGHHHCEHGMDFGGGEYPEFFPLARHVLLLDPYFFSAVSYSAASLAFNLSKPEQALELVDLARSYWPGQWRYLTLAAAIGYSRARDPVKVAETLTPLVRDPSAPVMVKQLVAFLNKRAGRKKAAYEIYLDIYRTAKDPFYTENAARELKKLAAEAGAR